MSGIALQPTPEKAARSRDGWSMVVLAFLLLVLTVGGFVVFGVSEGTEKRQGLRWANPLASKKSISLRACTLNGGHLKVNDKLGNPIEIANVTVWHVANTARAVFDVDDYKAYVAAQSETALRHVAASMLTTIWMPMMPNAMRSPCAATSLR